MTDNNKQSSLTRRMQDFLASYTGKVVLNYAYSWGAAVVILGALFKLTHLPGANAMLFIGMGAEVLVFFISAFDRPFKSYKWESVFPHIKISGAENKNESNLSEEAPDEMQNALADAMHPTGTSNGPIIIGGISGTYQHTQTAESATPTSAASSAIGNPAQPSGVIPSVFSIPNAPAVTPGIEVSEEMEEATKAYLEQLKEMTDALSHFVEQTKNMGQDADQINTLNKNLTGINAIYEIQLRNISSQLGTLDQINEQTRKMARQIDELNTVYARMLEAMTVNMKINGGN